MDNSKKQEGFATNYDASKAAMKTCSIKINVSIRIL